MHNFSVMMEAITIVWLVYIALVCYKMDGMRTRSQEESFRRLADEVSKAILDSLPVIPGDTVLDPEQRRFVKLKVDAKFIPLDDRSSFQTIADNGQLTALQWGTFLRYVNHYFKRTLPYKRSLLIRVLSPVYNTVLQRAEAAREQGDVATATDMAVGVLLAIERELWWIGRRPVFFWRVQQRATALLQTMQPEQPARTHLQGLHFNILIARLAFVLPWERKYEKVWKGLLQSAQ